MSISSLLTNIPILNGLASTLIGGPQSQMITSPAYQISQETTPGINRAVTFTNNTNAPVFVLNTTMEIEDPVVPFAEIIIGGTVTTIAYLNQSSSNATGGSLILPIGASFRLTHEGTTPSFGTTTRNIILQYLANSALTAVYTVNV